ncbi:TPA: hypothetical protein N6Y24_004191 [Escherichia coli]|uniref:Uncharacterized protein n=1 Tax=Kluyvera ascorbata TaxID=51288 RepID=A0A3N2RSH0_9ENTR|nr:hypothetical protein [Enterobacter roggenkampii]ROU10365.1 hypothetical protein EB837_21575 [Kluyvera ascorbata]GBE71516.1 hypothetical protein EKINANG_31660 [Enterobacter sp. KINAN-G]HAH9788176.1 hypothetical protein [Escherichia coli]HBN4808850.1 hypothetical protein [Escherichia coli]
MLCLGMVMFRANEEAEKLKAEAINYFLIKEIAPWRKDNIDAISETDRKRAEDALSVICTKLGPVVSSYPEWHPVIALGRDKSIPCYRDTQTTPSFPRLDHTRYMANGIITCPYGDTDELIAAVKRSYWDLMQYLSSDDMRFSSLSGWLRMASDSIELRASYITDELITAFKNSDFDYDGSDVLSDVSGLIPLYANTAKPVLIWWSWNNHALESDGTIPPAVAVPLMLSRTLADLSYAQLSESWENMRYLLLGSPHGARSSLLLNQLTVKQLRTMFNGLMDSGAFGPKKG